MKGRLRSFLRKVQNQAETLVAEYRYNGLGVMIGVHEDTDTDGDADASDKWYYPAYDEAWRMLANFRESDSSPKEEWVNHLAGDDGYGGASYINGVVLRDKDANTDWVSASDGTLEQRAYLCQNWRGDVSALVKTGKLLLEWDKYSAYGIPFGLPGADTDSDGDCEGSGAGNDIAAIQGLIDTSAYGVRADVDLDGDVDNTDKTIAQDTFSGDSLGWHSLSGTGNTRSYAGHSASPCLGAIAHARHRTMSLDLGRWVQRDPMRNRDGQSPYVFVRSSPLVRFDPYGLFSLLPIGGWLQEYCEVFPLDPLCIPYVPGCVLPLPWGWGSTCCENAAWMNHQVRRLGALPKGSTTCCDGKVVSCNYYSLGYTPSSNVEPTAFANIANCVDVHEETHRGHFDPTNPCSGNNAKRYGDHTYEAPTYKPGYNKTNSEIEALGATLDCLGASDCKNAQDVKACQAAMNNMTKSTCGLLQTLGGRHPACLPGAQSASPSQPKK